MRTLLALIAALMGTPVQAHGLQHWTDQGEAVVIQLSFGRGTPPALASYQIFAPGQREVYQTGRSDVRARIVFVPDRAGDWRVQVSTDDGHGASITVAVDSDLRPLAADARGSDRGARVVAGVGYLLGLAGLIMFWRARKASGNARS